MPTRRPRRARHDISLFFTLAIVTLCALRSIPAAAEETFEDPVAYCAAVGNVDRPDARWAGPKLPEAVTNALVPLGLVAPGVPPEMARNTVWRCMHGKVWLCSYGANLPCDAKADTRRTPTPAMEQFCQQSSESDSIPAYVSGHATVYAWRCRDGAPAIERELVKPDARGFLSNIWYELPAAPR